MKINIQFVIKRILPVVAGAVLGYAYYHFIGCRTNTCPITSNPFITTIYGAFAGLIFALPSKKKKVVNDNEGN